MTPRGSNKRSASHVCVPTGMTFVVSCHTVSPVVFTNESGTSFHDVRGDFNIQLFLSYFAQTLFLLFSLRDITSQFEAQNSLQDCIFCCLYSKHGLMFVKMQVCLHTFFCFFRRSCDATNCMQINRVTQGLATSVVVQRISSVPK